VIALISIYPQLIRRLASTDWYSLSGRILLRHRPEVGAIVAQLRELCQDGIGVVTRELDRDRTELTVQGHAEMAEAAVREIERLLGSLGPFALDAEVFEGQFNHLPREVVVVRPGDDGRVLLSGYRLRQVQDLIADLVPDHRAWLIDLLREAKDNRGGETS
jgi:hypothetical protein